jgi:hypothetical protein
LVQKPEGERRDYLGDQSRDERVILKCILKKLGYVRVYIYKTLRYVSTLAS